MSIFKNFNLDKLKEGLSKTRNNLINKITETINRKAKIDASTIDELEEILISSDIGYDISEKIIDTTRKLLLKESDRSNESIKQLIKNELIEIVGNNPEYSIDYIRNRKPYVILIIGVNGSGKTTSVGKLAYNFKTAGLDVIVGSADTFRAAANDQLEIWANRAGVSLIQGNSNDPSAVAFDTLQAAKKLNSDIVLIDTAGRLHTQKNLMDELSKINKVIYNNLKRAPDEILLILDGTTGQNAVYQVNEFAKYIDVTGLVITKLDGTAKGGIVFQILSNRKIPIKFIGVGEGIEDLQSFDPTEFVNAIL